MNLHKLEEAVLYKFSDVKLLEKALTHASYSMSSNKTKADLISTHYERLEFLGDRVLGLVIAEMLYLQFPDEPEGDLAKRFSALVCEDTLAEIMLKIGIDKYMRLSEAEENLGGRENKSIIADIGEALIGAMYLDGGLVNVSKFVRKYWYKLMLEKKEPPKDAKTELQELVQSKKQSLPKYKVVAKEGFDHDPTFVVEVEIDGNEKAVGRGRSKREAERNAAVAMLEIMNK